MTGRHGRTSRARRLLVVATLAAAMLVPTAAIATADAPGSSVESAVTAPVLAWLGLSWL